MSPTHGCAILEGKHHGFLEHFYILKNWMLCHLQQHGGPRGYYSKKINKKSEKDKYGMISFIGGILKKQNKTKTEIDP